jgi:hypothetical protein
MLQHVASQAKRRPPVSHLNGDPREFSLSRNWSVTMAVWADLGRSATRIGSCASGGNSAAFSPLSPLAVPLLKPRVLGRQALTGLALAYGYDTAFWWTAGLFAGGAVAGGILFRRGPLYQRDAASGSPAGEPSLSSSLDPQTPPTPAAAPGHRIDLT